MQSPARQSENRRGLPEIVRPVRDDGWAPQGTRNRATVQPQPHNFVAQTENYRAVTIPWIRQERPVRRQVSWLAGHSLMHAFPDPRLGVVQWPPLAQKGHVHRAIRLQLQGQPRIWEVSSRTAFPIKPLMGHRRDHRRTGKPDSSESLLDDNADQANCCYRLSQRSTPRCHRSVSSDRS